MGEFTHFNQHGDAIMVDISKKAETAREAIAEGRISMNQECFDQLKAGSPACVIRNASWSKTHSEAVTRKKLRNCWLRLFFKNLPPIALKLFPPSQKTPKCHALAADTIQLSQYHHIRRIHMQPQALLWMFFFTKRPPEFFCCLHTDPVKMISAAFFRLLCMLRHHHDHR